MNYDDILNAARANLMHCKGPSGEAAYLAAVSGGPDSVLLLHVLNQLRTDPAWDQEPCIKVAHFNHGLRGEASDADEVFVRELCRKWGFDVVIGRAVDVPRGLAGSSETWAREQRHRFLQREREHLSPGAWLLLGHHADDRLETILINLGRGSGPGGLAAMPAFDRRSYISRPLLDLSREDVTTTVDSLGLSYRHDLSNEDTGTWRNRLRLDVIPALKEMFGEGLLTRVGQTADILSAEDLYMADVSQRLYQDEIELLRGHDGELLYQLIDTKRLAAHPKALRRRLLQLIIVRLKGDETDISYQLISSLDHLLTRDAAAAMNENKTESSGSAESSHDLPFAITLVRSATTWRFYAKEALNAYEGPLFIPLKAAGGKRYEKSAIFLYNREDSLYAAAADELRRFFREDAYSAPKTSDSTYNVYCLVVVSSLQNRLRMRTRRTGDKMRLGNSAVVFHKSVKQYMQERGVWPELRDRLLLVELEGEVVWIPGLISVNPLINGETDQSNQVKLTELRFL